jgi:hypothetical protein
MAIIAPECTISGSSDGLVMYADEADVLLSLRIGEMSLYESKSLLVLCLATGDDESFLDLK